MIKVVSLASYTFLPAKTGGQKGIALFNKYFSRQVEQLCLTTKANQNELAQGYQTLRYFSASPLRYVDPLHFFRIRKILKGFGATHLIVEHPYLGWLGFLLRRASRVKLVVHSHNIEGLRFRSLNKRWWKILWNYERWVHRQADYSFFITAEDRQYAIQHFGLHPENCLVVTFGIEREKAPDAAEISEAKKSVRAKHGIGAEEKLLLFAGAFNYAPNLKALKAIEEEIAPRLKKQSFPFRILICGPGLDNRQPAHPNVAYAGFVDDIYMYFKAADVFLNAVSEGGGIKTKLVEALGMNANAVSCREGAIGVDPQICNGKLALVENDDWDAFARAVIALSSTTASIPPAYFEHFYWGYSTKKAFNFIQEDA